jgi:hypothetical protein
LRRQFRTAEAKDQGRNQGCARHQPVSFTESGSHIGLTHSTQSLALFENYR